MTIRDAKEVDLPAIVAIHNAAIRSRISTAQLDPVSVEERKSWLAEHSPGVYPLWIAEEGTRIAGWLSFQSFLPRNAYRGTAEISVYVGESFRRQGIGSALVGKAIAQAPPLGLHTLVGLIFGHNEPSLRLFETMRFERWGMLPQIAQVDQIGRDLIIVGRHVYSCSPTTK